LFTQPETSTRQEKILLFLLGALGIYGFMFFYLLGLSKTTPVSSSIFSSFSRFNQLISSKGFLGA
jgi:drug/metabolite transporter (DMT)-like permease